VEHPQRGYKYDGPTHRIEFSNVGTGLFFALDRKEGDPKCPCLVNVGWYATLSEAQTALAADFKRTGQ
jgi:hypothetical protein